MLSNRNSVSAYTFFVGQKFLKKRLPLLLGLSLILALLPGIGFWVNTHRDKTQNAKYLLQIEPDSFAELATNSTYPAFTSSYYIRRGETNPSQVNVPIVDPECYADFYLVCLDSKKGKYKKLFDCMHEGTVL